MHLGTLLCFNFVTQPAKLEMNNNNNNTKMDFSRLPEELLIEILLRIEDQSWLSNGIVQKIGGQNSQYPPNVVCKQWCRILTSGHFWRLYHRFWSGQEPPSHLPDHWVYLSSICAKNNWFEKNLLKNVNGELTTSKEFHAQDNRIVTPEGLVEPWPEYQHWIISGSAGQGWKVEQNHSPKKPLQINPNTFERHPEFKEHNLKFPSWYFTSYHSCTKKQLINLEDFFGGPKVARQRLFDKKPELIIKFGQWYCMRGPCKIDLTLKFMTSSNHELIEVGASAINNNAIDIPNQWRYLECILVTEDFMGTEKLVCYHGATCNEVIGNEEIQKKVGVCLAGANVTISYPTINA
jgi:hypothetical protein